MAALELEHSISGVFTVPNALHLHPNGKEYISIGGASVLISDLSDPHNQKFLRGHSGLINTITLCKNGSLVASAQLGDDADIYIWDFNKKKLLHKLAQHEHGVTCMAFSDDGRLFVSIGDQFDHQLYVWDMASGFIVANLQLTVLGSSSIHQTLVGGGKRPPPPPPQLASATSSVVSGKGAIPIGQAEGNIIAVCWGGHARDIKRRETEDYIFATAGPNVSLWTLTPATGNLTQVKFSQGSNVRTFTTVGFTAEGDKVIAGTSSGDFAVFLVRTMVLETLIQACSNGIRSLHITPTNGVLIGGGDGFLRLFRPSPRSVYASAKELQLGEGYTTALRQPVTAVTTGGSDERALAAGTEGTVYAVTLGDFRQTPVCSSHAGPVLALAFPRGVSDKFATCCADDESVRVWDLSSYDQLSSCSVPKAHPVCVGWIGECIAAGYSTGEIRFIDAYDGNALWTILDAHKGGVTAINTTGGASSSSASSGPSSAASSASTALSPSARRAGVQATSPPLSSLSSLIVSGGAAGEVRLWDVKTRQMRAHMKEHAQAVVSVAVFRDSRHAVTASRDKSVSCIDFLAERRMSSFKTKSAIFGVDVFYDEKRIVTANIDKSITFFDLSVADPVRIITDAHEDQVTAITTAHSLDLFASGGADHTVKLWGADGRLLNQYAGHSSGVNAMQFSPDDKQLISVGNDGNVLIWNLF